MSTVSFRSRTSTLRSRTGYAGSGYSVPVRAVRTGRSMTRRPRRRRRLPSRGKRVFRKRVKAIVGSMSETKSLTIFPETSELPILNFQDVPLKNCMFLVRRLTPQNSSFGYSGIRLPLVQGVTANDMIADKVYITGVRLWFNLTWEAGIEDAEQLETDDNASVGYMIIRFTEKKQAIADGYLGGYAYPLTGQAETVLIQPPDVDGNYSATNLMAIFNKIPVCKNCQIGGAVLPTAANAPALNTIPFRSMSMAKGITILKQGIIKAPDHRGAFVDGKRLTSGSIYLPIKKHIDRNAQTFADNNYIASILERTFILFWAMDPNNDVCATTSLRMNMKATTFYKDI